MNNVQWITILLALQVIGKVTSASETRLVPTKIVGGSEVRITTAPFLLGLHARRDGFICGAVIISAWWGMTALHCLTRGMAVGNYHVRAGSSISIVGGSMHRFKKIYSYNNSLFTGKSIPPHDIVLFLVATPFQFSNRIRPAKLPSENSVPPKVLQVSGWGHTDTSDEIFPTALFLHTANVTKIAWKDCITATSWYQWVVNEKTHLCYGEGNADACFGDSGGPLADATTVYGIVSFGEGCGTSPGVYTKVSYYRRWIKRITDL